MKKTNVIPWYHPDLYFTKSIKLLFLVYILLVIIFAIWFYSASESSSGWIASKWSETKLCNRGCSSSVTYYIQLQDGRVYSVFWDTADWDSMMENSEISFIARGRHINFFMWRLMVPTIYSWQQLTPARTGGD